MVVQLDRGRDIFRSQCVTRCIEPELKDEMTNTACYSRSNKVAVTKQHDFTKAGETEIQGLIDNGTVKKVDQ